MRLTVLYIFVIILYGYGCQTDDASSQFPKGVPGLEIKDQIIIGEDIADSIKIFVAAALQIDKVGNIYVFDEGTMEIKIFSPEGTPLRIIGGRGRGPGEFISCSGFFIYRDSLYVFDQQLQRVNVFTTGGTLLQTHSFKVAAPVILKPLSGGQHLGIHTDFNPNYYQRRFARTYLNDFSNPGEPFLQLAKLDQDLEELIEVMAIYLGSVGITAKDEFIFVPYIYNGRLYKFKESEPNQWEHIDTYRGYTELFPYTNLENTTGRHFDFGWSSAGRNKTMKYVVHNQSRGLLEHKKKIYHFTHCEFEDGRNERIFGVEIFDEQMQPIGYVPIKSIQIANEPGNGIGWHAEAMDKEGNVYIRERNRGKSSIRLLTFDWEKEKR